MTEKPFPTQAQVVIIGGGVIGCSVAYHLTKLGWRDIVLMERKDLTCGTTWHAAGLVETGTFTSLVKSDMSKYTQDLFQRLGEETGQDTGFRRVGYLELASSEEWVEGLRRAADFGRYQGNVIEELSPSEIKRLWPLLKPDDLLAGFFCPDDARVNPVDATMALAKGARMGGALVFEDTKVTAINQKNGRVTGVVTDKGEIKADYVVNCGGMWGRELGQMAGVNVPLHAAEHYYLITEPIDGIHPDLPILDDPARFAYYREETGGLLIGLFEPVAAPWGMDGIPESFKFDELTPDWDRMIPHLEQAMERIPAAKAAGVHKFFCGPESFTPDREPLMGEAPELKNYYVAAGFNSLGILLAGGVGQVMAQWIVDGLPPIDVSDVHIARILPFQNNPRYLRDRTVEVLGLTYAQDYFNLQNETARNIRKSPFHDRLAEAGACFGAYAGWEYPDWFAPEGIEPKVEYTWGRQNWFEYAAAEHRAAREGVILMDYSVMGKLLVQGRDAEKVLNRICANDVAVPVGRCVYTQWLNERGRIEADLTVTRLAEDQFLVLTGDGTITAAQAWLKRNIAPDAHVFVTNVTSAYSVLNIQGPKSRDLLSRVTNVDMSNEAVPFLTLQEIDIGYALVLALRVSYVGELGWELYIPTEFSLHVFDMLVEAGKDVGLVFAGLQALETLRLEKAYRNYGNDVDNLDTPLEAGLSRFVDFDKPGGFIGKEALLRHKQTGIKHRLVQFLMDDPEPLLYYNETIYRDGEPAGRILAGGYGHTLGASVGLGYVENKEGVTADYIKSGIYEVQVAGVRYPAKASLQPMYDPTGERVRS
jgi:glycine cleavage system aminomethyltransferase T/glycine/D-amino acid oxidase-like deaminating enzyme